MTVSNLYSYSWRLSDAVFSGDKGKVFSCFACGGGSTMGYKLAGYDVLGCNEVDEAMMSAYIRNLSPKYAFLEPIQTFKLREDLPQELYDLDILDGSPPCSSFSTSGSREKYWGKEKKFREGQSKQVLDTLFFDFIDLADKLKPKVVIAENVKGLLLGNAKKYLQLIYNAFDKAGYYCQHYLLDASRMGVPQKRERVFFVCLRKDLANKVPNVHTLFDAKPELVLNFAEHEIEFGEFYQNGVDDRPEKNGKMFDYWSKRHFGDISFCDTIMREEGVRRCFSNKYIYQDKVCPTYTASSRVLHLYDEYRSPNKYESCCIGSYPHDYDFTGVKYSYLIGMSVPPVMMAQVANQVYVQWLSRL